MPTAREIGYLIVGLALSVVSRFMPMLESGGQCPESEATSTAAAAAMELHAAPFAALSPAAVVVAHAAVVAPAADASLLLSQCIPVRTSHMRTENDCAGTGQDDASRNHGPELAWDGNPDTFTHCPMTSRGHVEFVTSGDLGTPTVLSMIRFRPRNFGPECCGQDAVGGMWPCGLRRHLSLPVLTAIGTFWGSHGNQNWSKLAEVPQFEFKVDSWVELPVAQVPVRFIRYQKSASSFGMAGEIELRTGDCTFAATEPPAVIAARKEEERKHKEAAEEERARSELSAQSRLAERLGHLGVRQVKEMEDLRQKPGPDNLTMLLLKHYHQAEADMVNATRLLSAMDDTIITRTKAALQTGTLDVPHSLLWQKLQAWLKKERPLRLALTGGSASAGAYGGGASAAYFAVFGRRLQALAAELGLEVDAKNNAAQGMYSHRSKSAAILGLTLASRRHGFTVGGSDTRLPCRQS